VNVRSLITALLGENPDAEVFLCPNVAPVDAVQSCAGDPLYDLKPYLVLHSACRYPQGHGA
jgi:hypothetical protein